MASPRYSYLSGIDTYAAADGNPHLKRALDGITAQLNAVTAGQQTFDTDSGSQASPSAPATADFNVQGIDGKFVIDITNPQDVTPLSQQIRQQNNLSDLNSTGQVIIHQFRSADDLAITTNVTTYDPDSAVHKEIQQPNVTKYWQMRSSFDGTLWNDWQYFTSAIVCGPVPVWSGLMRSTSEVLVNNAATASDGISPISQHLTTTQIDVAAKTWKLGNQSLAYSSGSADPGSYGLKYVYALDQKRAGGTVTYLATASVADITSDDSAIYFGKITTAGGGGGTGSGGGAGACPGAGSMIELYPGGQFVDAKDVRQGMQLLALDGGPETVIDDPELEIQNCFSVELDTGEVLKCCSSTHPVRYAQAGFVSLFDLVVSDVIKTKAGTGKVTKINFIGAKVVYHIHLDRTRTYFVDGILAHNMNASLK